MSGTISAADGVDLTATSLTVDGISTPISVQENGSYSVSIAEGTHTLVFANGKYGATKEITVVNGENIADVTLVNGTWLAGNYGSLSSNNTPELNENGTYTVSGKDQMIIFPNTATSNSFTYEVTVNNITRTNDEAVIGICLTDGNNKLTVGCRRYENAQISMGVSASEESNVFYGKWSTLNTSDSVKFKFVIDKENSQILFYINNDLRFTFTKDSITPNVFEKKDWGDTLTSVYAEKIAGFFAESSKIAVGINGAFKYSATATYACSISDN